MKRHTAPVEGLGRRIREARVGIGLSQEDVAKELGVMVLTYRHWERGRCEPRLRSLAAMAELFGVSIDWFAGWE